MKANLASKEPELIKLWQEQRVYQAMVASSPATRRFTMADGPPYANGHLHMGHVLNKCLKDFVIKTKNMAGFRAPFIPGWDCHGLPIEHNITKKLGAKIKEKTDKDIRQLCREEAQKWVDTQREEFIRLGILADWQQPYLTLERSYEAEEVREFGRIFKNGVIYRGKKPVLWCIPLQTALAEAEVEYHNHKSPAIYVKMPWTPDAHFGHFTKPVYAIIWTTTPWTLPANQGIALHPEFDYSFYDMGDEIFLLATAMKDKVEVDTAISIGPALATFKGTAFEYQKAKHPWYDRDSLMVLGDHVTLEAGTGLVHTAPGHGAEDYVVGVQYNLPLQCPVKEDGTYNKEVPEYEGTNVFAANPLIVADLQKMNRLVHHKDLEHSYPHCWRSKYPLIFRATAQWFIRMDDQHYNIREQALGALKDIQFIPSWGVKRLSAMIENRPDWCISRQRNWGVPLPVFYCRECDEPLLSEEVINKIAEHMENGQGIEAYYDTPLEELLGTAKCQSCGGSEFKKGKDILDVWFDSGVCHAAVQRRREGLNFPADLYLEGSDQHRGWFQTSLITAIGSQGKSPFKTLLTHNFVNDEKGRKMSKSLGNVVDPKDLIKESGAEILRLWAASQDYGQDINYSQNSFQRVTESYRRLRNTMRFLLGNLNDFTAHQDLLTYDELLPLDRWALDRFAQFLEHTYQAYGDFEFYKVYHGLNNFFTVDLSNHYLDMIKDRLYTAQTEGKKRRSCQTVLYHLTKTLMTVMAPLTSFLSEEAYSHFGDKSSTTIFTEKFPEIPQPWVNLPIREDYARLFEIRAVVSKELEEKRQAKEIGSSLEAQVLITANAADLKLLAKYQSSMTEFFITSGVAWNEGPALKVDVSKAEGEKCPRCWHVQELKELAPFGKICPKCIEALS